MKRMYIFLMISVLVGLSACSHKSQVPVPTIDNDANVLGRLTVNISGVGSEVLHSTAYFTPELTSQLTENSSYLSSDFSNKIATTFVYGGIRYINVVYTFPNKSNVSKEIILVAVADNTTFSHNGIKTPFRHIKDYEGNPITNNNVGLKIGVSKDYDLAAGKFITHRYDSYVNNLNISGLNANEARGETILTEGFQAWKADFSSRVIPAGEDAKVLFSTSFSRRVNNQISKDPFSFNMVFLVAEK